MSMNDPRVGLAICTLILTLGPLSIWGLACLAESIGNWFDKRRGNVLPVSRYEP